MNAKKIIAEAAFSLFKERPFDDITVQMILDKAEVSRKTFYKYYFDKYELMELFYRSFMDQNIQENFNGRNFEQVVCHLYDFVKMNSSYFLNVVEISGHRSFWDFLREYSIEVYQSIRLQNTHADSLTEKERLFIIMMIDGQMSLLKQLVKGKVTLDREEFADLLCSIMPDSYKAILEKDPVG